MTAIEALQTTLNGLGLKAVEARLESLLEQASKKEPSKCVLPTPGGPTSSCSNIHHEVGRGSSSTCPFCADLPG